MSTAMMTGSVTPDQVELVRRTIASGATDDELKLFLYDCQRRGVHPLDKLLHFTKRGGKYTPITSIDLFRTRAGDTMEHAGTDDALFESAEDGKPIAATVTVYRIVQTQRCAFTATARWAEYYPGDQQGHMWRKMPFTMLGKCAEALALRKAFPQQLGGLYTSEEMDQAPAEDKPTAARSAKPKSDPVADPAVMFGLSSEIQRTQGKIGKEQSLALCSRIVGRTIQKANEVTASEASKLLAYFKGLPDLVVVDGLDPAPALRKKLAALCGTTAGQVWAGEYVVNDLNVLNAADLLAATSVERLSVDQMQAMIDHLTEVTK